MEYPQDFEPSLEAVPVKLAQFEGPLDLLLHLIKKNEVNIYDIPIALITAQYLETIELMQELNLDVAGEFVVMAATLIHIKSKMLLPRPDTSAGLEALFVDAGDRPSLILTFLALLEMIRLKLVRVFQSGPFGPIRVYKRPRPSDAPHPLRDPEARRG